jgi:hypothetical protein
MPPRWLGWLGWLALATACSPRNNGTLLVARVETDMMVPGDIDGLEIRLVPEHGGGTTDSFPLTAATKFPVTLAIRPSGDPGFSVDVTAIGRKGTGDVVTQTATVPFSPGEARQFTLLLSRDCARPMPCPSATTVCLKGGACVPKTMVAQTQPYTPLADAGSDGPPADAVFDAGNRDARDNPGQWVAAVPTFPATGATLSGVWPSDDGTVWVVGSLQSRGLAARLVQAQWTEAVLPTGTPTLFGAWGSGPTDVWAAGVNGTVVRFDGNAWAAVPLSGAAATQTLTSVWGASSNDVWVVGEAGTILRGNATGVARETSNTTDNLVGVWGTSASEVWALTARGTVLRRDGTGWTVQAASLAPHIFYGVWLSARSDVWIVGAGVTMHNDGTAWATATNALDSATSVWGSASDDIWAVGRPTAPGTTYISRFDGVRWVAAASPSAMPLQAVRGTSATNVWAVGNGGTVLRLAVP